MQSGPCEDRVMNLDQAYVKNTYRVSYGLVSVQKQFLYLPHITALPLIIIIIFSNLKVGILYCKKGQQTEEDMYNNEEGGPAFNEFLDLIGQRVRLKGFEKYKAGLCTKDDSTGLYSIYASHEQSEIMFHVSTLLPFTPNNRQQLPRKRYIGNDIVTVVFQEPGALPFIPNIKSQFQHVFIVVRVNNPCSDHTSYSVAVSRSKSVPTFGPPLPKNSTTFPKSKAFSNFLLTKIINAENAVTTSSDKFVSMATRTRQEILRDLATNYITQSTIDPGSKFNLFATKRKDKLRPRFSPDTSGLQGALSWRVVAEDCSTRSPTETDHLRGGGLMTRSVAHASEVDAFIGISSDSLLLVQDNGPRHDILFVISTKCIIGWTIIRQTSIRIYFHQGEALILHSKDVEDREDMGEIAARLKSVSDGAPTQDFTLRRNQMGQLGFHVQHDGLVTEVENFGYAWQTGLRQGSRLVEICKQPVTSMSHEAMVDLLKTSMSVTVTVIPPHPDGQPRKGCHMTNCAYIYGALDPSLVEDDDFGDTLAASSGFDDGDYENVPPILSTAIRTTVPKQDSPNHKYGTVISEDNGVTGNSSVVDGKQFATSQRPNSSRSTINHLEQPRTDINPTSQPSTILRRSSAYAYPAMANTIKETNTMHTNDDSAKRTMSSPPRSSSSSGYGTGSSRKSSSHQNNNIIKDRSSIFHDQRTPATINKEYILSNTTTQHKTRWYEDNLNPKSAQQNTQYLKKHHQSTEVGPLRGIEMTHSSSSPMSSISDTSPSSSPAVIHQLQQTQTFDTSNNNENVIVAQPSNGILFGSKKIGSGKNSAFQRVISSNRGNINNNQCSTDVKNTIAGDPNMGSSASSATNSTTSASPRITQMIYQQPPKPNKLLNKESDKFSVPNLSITPQTIYGSGGNTNKMIYSSRQDSPSVMQEKQAASYPGRSLLEEKRSIDAKVQYAAS